MRTTSATFIALLALLGACGAEDQGSVGDSDRADEFEGEWDCVKDAPAPNVGDVNNPEVSLGGVLTDCKYRAQLRAEFVLSGPEFSEMDPDRIAWLDGEDVLASGTNHFFFSVATTAAKRCSLAAQQRFWDIMSDPSQAVLDYQERYPNWIGQFYNVTQDYSEMYGDKASAQLAFHSESNPTGIINFISVALPDGMCSLPTQDMVTELLSAK
jgi:hypothetical protein